MVYQRAPNNIIHSAVTLCDFWLETKKGQINAVNACIYSPHSPLVGHTPGMPVSDVTEVTTSKLEITLRAPEHFSVTGFTVLEFLMTSKLNFRCAKMLHSFEDECFMSFVNIFDNFICFCRVYWPMFVLIFYILSPIPTFISRRLSDDSESSNACRELAYFLTTGIVVSSFGLPIVLARTNTVSSLYLFSFGSY